MKYLALLAVVAVAYAAQPEVQPIVLPEPALPYVEAPQEVANAFVVQVVDAPVQQIKAEIPVPEDVMKKVMEATNYVFRKSESEAVKVVNAPEAETFERVQVVDAPIETTFDRVQVVDAPIETTFDRVQVVDAPIETTFDRVQVVDAPIETTFDRVQVVDEFVLTPVNLETPVERVHVVDAPIMEEASEMKIQGRWPGKVYPNPLLRGKQ